MEHKTILLISPEAWGTNFVSKHHYAHYLSKKNRVYFLNPAHSYSKIPFAGVSCTTKQVADNLTIVDYVNLLPRLNNLPKGIQKTVYKKQARSIQTALGVEQFDLIWSFDPNRYFDQSVWKADKTIYHTVDFHPHAQFEKDIVLSSDFFFGVTDLILKEHELYRKGIEISHAADLEGFEHIETIEIPGKNAIRAIYTGNFHQHIDYELLTQLATTHKTVDFLMIGPKEKSNLASKNTVESSVLAPLEKMDNLYFLGSVSPTLLMSYLSVADINLVLFKKENEKIHCSPHKLMGYFYAGNVTLSNYIDAHKHTEKDIIYMTENTLEDFQQIKENLAHWNSPALREKRRLFACENSYINKIKSIEKRIYASHD